MAVLTPTSYPLFETDMDIWGECLLYKTCGQACSSGLIVHSFLKSGSCVWRLMSATRFIFKAACSPVEHFASNQFISPSCCENKRKTQTFLYSSFPAIPTNPTSTIWRHLQANGVWHHRRRWLSLWAFVWQRPGSPTWKWTKNGPRKHVGTWNINMWPHISCFHICWPFCLHLFTKNLSLALPQKQQQSATPSRNLGEIHHVSLKSPSPQNVNQLCGHPIFAVQQGPGGTTAHQGRHH